MNKQLLIGNVGADPEINVYDGGKTKARIRVATTEKYNDKDHTEWHTVVAWGKLAEIIGKYVKKGSKLYIEGKTTHREYEGKWYTEVVVREFTMLDSKPKEGSGTAAVVNEPIVASEVDELPF